VVLHEEKEGSLFQRTGGSAAELKLFTTTLTWESVTSGSAMPPSPPSAGPSCSLPMQLLSPRRDVNSLSNRFSPNARSPVTGTSAYSGQHFGCFMSEQLEEREVCNINMLSDYLQPGRITENVISNLNQKGHKLTACIMIIWISSSIRMNITAV